MKTLVQTLIFSHSFFLYRDYIRKKNSTSSLLPKTQTKKKLNLKKLFLFRVFFSLYNLFFLTYIEIQGILYTPQSFIFNPSHFAYIQKISVFSLLTYNFFYLYLLVFSGKVVCLLHNSMTDYFFVPSCQRCVSCGLKCVCRVLGQKCPVHP